MKYVSKRVDFSPVFQDEEERVKACVNEMQNKGYVLDMTTDTGIAGAVLVFHREPKVNLALL